MPVCRVPARRNGCGWGRKIVLLVKKKQLPIVGGKDGCICAPIFHASRVWELLRKQPPPSPSQQQKQQIPRMTDNQQTDFPLPLPRTVRFFCFCRFCQRVHPSGKVFTPVVPPSSTPAQSRIPFHACTSVEGGGGEDHHFTGYRCGKAKRGHKRGAKQKQKRT